MAAWLGPEVGVEGKQTIDAVHGGVQVFGDNFGGFRRNPSKVLVDFLKGRQDQFLGLFIVFESQMRDELPDDIEVDILSPGEGGRDRKHGMRLFGVGHSGNLPAASDEKHHVIAAV
jgi:hypothetical protein